LRQYMFRHQEFQFFSSEQSSFHNWTAPIIM
jgi:hypothetical protein